MSMFDAWYKTKFEAAAKPPAPSPVPVQKLYVTGKFLFHHVLYHLNLEICVISFLIELTILCQALAKRTQGHQCLKSDILI